MQALLDIFLLQHGVIELDLRVLLDEIVMNLGFTDTGAAGHKSLQLGQQDVFAERSLQTSRA